MRPESPTSAAGRACPGWCWQPASPPRAFDLIESVGRKCDFLREAIERMGLENASVVCERSEEWAGGDGREAYDAVTARAVGSLATLAELASPLLVEGGVLAAWKGARSEAEEAEVARGGFKTRHGAARDPERAALRRQPRQTHPPPPQEWTDSERIAAPAGDGGEAAVRLRTALTRTIRMGTVYAIANQKGGVGKTTTAVNMGACVAADGQQTLIVDLDAQCNATVALGLPKDSSPSSYDCLSGEVSVAEAARPAGPDNLWIVPAHVDLAGAAVELPRFSGYETRLRDGLGPVRSRFAYTLLDCPPSLGPVAVNALVAADKVIVPVQAEYLALEGLVQFLDTLKLVRRELNPDLEIAGVLITMTDDRTRLSQDVERELREHLPARVFKTVVPRSVRLAEAPSYGIPVSEHDPKSTGSKAYRALADEVLALGAVDG